MWLDEHVVSKRHARRAGNYKFLTVGYLDYMLPGMDWHIFHASGKNVLTRNRRRMLSLLN